MATVTPCSGRAAQEAADQLLAAPVAVDVGGVDQGDAGVDRRAQHGERIVLADSAPVGAELPGAEPGDPYLAPGATERALLHDH